MTISRIWTTVSTNWLKEQIAAQLKSKNMKNLRVLDTSFVGDREVDSYQEHYMSGHIPQSVHFDLWKCVESTKLIPRNVPDRNCFTDYVQSLGVWPDTHVVTYDRLGPLPAYRTWWLFRMYGHRKISVLDGGFKKWEADGYEVTKHVPQFERSTFKAHQDPSLVRYHEQMLENLQTKREQIVDGRSPDSSSIIEIEEKDGGIIPGSVHVDFDLFFNEDGTIKPDRDIKQLFDAAGVDLGRPIVGTCQLGMAACGVAAGAHILGKENVPVYYGSWMEWKQRVTEELKQRVRV